MSQPLRKRQSRRHACGSLALPFYLSLGSASYEGGAKRGKHIQLIGYSFLYIAALYLCIHLGTPKHPALADLSVVGSESIIAAFSIGFLLLFIGHYLSGQQKN